jgi:hypothetical protein
MAALSQLSYSPFEFKVIGKGNTRALPVAGRVQSEVQLLHAGDASSGYEKAAIELAAVHANQVDLPFGVGRAHASEPFSFEFSTNICSC